MNDLFTPESIATLSGATGATVVISNGIQRAFNFNPKWFALAVAMIISQGVVIMSGGTGSEYFLAIINGFLIYASAVGANSITGTDIGKGVTPRGTVESVNATKSMKFNTRWF